jgi:3-oxoacyl-[acyl-carrier protein] reductase
MERLKDRVALVTGSSRGIGKAIAIAFSREGAKVAVTYKREKEKAEGVACEIKEIGGEVICLQLEVTDRCSIKEALKEVSGKFGRLDILVNNAGINRPNDFNKITDEDWEEVIGVNLTGTFKVTQEALPFMDRGGSIINISSVSGQYGGPRSTHYCVSKAGVIAMTQNLAIFCAPMGIRVNAIAPGLIESEMANAAQGLGVEEKILMKRLGTTEEVAAAVSFLASDEAGYITGQTINANGGMYFG